MSLTLRIFRGSVLLTTGEAITQGCSLIRNIILARVLTQADFGTAALLAMTVSIFEIGGRLSIENCLVQSRQGGEPRFMAAAHLVQSVLGIISMVLIVGAAGPMAAFFDVPEAAWALRALGILPLLRALSHLDIYRMTKVMRFGPSVIVEAVPQLIVTLAAWPLAQVWPTYALLVWLLIARQFVSTLASHIVAESAYRWSLDLRTVRQILSFGWPLLVNGLLVFAIMQGDRFAVGVRFTVSSLAVYAVAGSVVLLPASTLLKLSGAIMLPLLAAAQANCDSFRRRVVNASQLYALFSGGYAAAFMVAGGPMVTLVFGQKYREAGTLTALLGLAQALRLLRGVPITAAVALGDTRNVMFSNVWRLSGVALAFSAAYAGASLPAIAGGAVVGEAVALVASFWRFSRIHRIPATDFLPSLLLCGGFISVSSVFAWQGVPNLPAWTPFATAALLVVSLILIHFALFSESRRVLLTTLGPWLRFLPNRPSALR